MRSSLILAATVFWLGFGSLPAVASGVDLLGVTEDVPPFSFLDKGRHAGLANEVLDRIVQLSGLRVQRSTQPWARALKTLAETHNSMVYVMVRTPSRAPLYRWVGPVDDCDVVVLALRNRQLSYRPRDPEFRRLRVGVIKGSPAGQMVRDTGVPEESLYLTPGSETSTKMLFAGHLDMLAGLELPYQHQAGRLGLDAGQLTVVHMLQKGFGCYFAFNPKVNDEVFRRFSSAFETLRAAGEIQALREGAIKAWSGPSRASRP